MVVLEKLGELQESFRLQISHMDARMGHIEDGLTKAIPDFKHFVPQTSTPGEVRNSSVSASAMTSPADVPKVPLRAPSEPSGEASALPSTTPPQPMSATVVASRDTDETNEDEEEPSPANREKNHTTAAHRLLDLWDCMSTFKEPGVYRPDYAFFMERDRGTLRPFGRGEGTDIDHMGHNRPGHATMANSPSEESNSPAPSPPEGMWGTLATGPVPGVDGRRSDQANPGGANPDGTLNLEEGVVRRLFKSYFDTLHRLHPFLSVSRLNRMLEVFIQRYSTPSAAKFAVPGPRNSMDSAYGGLPQKRKLSNGIPSSAPPNATHFDQSHSNRRIPEKSVNNAIVLLVLALGRICEHKTPLSGPVPAEPQPPFGTSPMTEHTEISPLPIKQSPQSSSPPTSIASPGTEVTRITQRSGRSSAEPHGFDRGSAKNVDRIPGLAYYAFASEILGGHLNGYGLSHIQAFLLAGLYVAQLARSLESWGWISMACRAWMVLVAKFPKSKLKETPKDTSQDLINFAFWTCLQLESDIHAELSELPLTGISDYEFKVHFPIGVMETFGDDGTIMQNIGNRPDLFYYSAQILLRTTLNKVHRGLYNKRRKSDKLLDSLEHYYAMIEQWRATLPPAFQWSDEDDPATDINTARLRAKYYGARYVISRPVLMEAIHKDSLDSDFDTPSRRADVHQLLSPGQQDPSPSLLKHCELCVEAAKHSTIAFDNVPHRLVVTNIWGTAHAQFGNMLVLAAVYNCKNENLQRLVSFAQLEKLMSRTIKFLRNLAPLSPVMKKDADILRYTWSQVAPGSALPVHSQSSSFGPF